MPTPNPHVAIFPGMFDPLTHGHLDIIERASKLYDRVIVAIGVNPMKQASFSPEERREMVVQHTGHLPNVEVQTYDCLTLEFARRVGARVILRGIRDNVDLHGELQIATANLVMGDIETVFLMTSPHHVLTSSNLIKQIVEMGEYDPKHLSRLVPLDVAEKLEELMRRSRA
jgi:pantetheine-phosphate adenylyltransferase